MLGVLRVNLKTRDTCLSLCQWPSISPSSPFFYCLVFVSWSKNTQGSGYLINPSDGLSHISTHVHVILAPA